MPCCHVHLDTYKHVQHRATCYHAKLPSHLLSPRSLCPRMPAAVLCGSPPEVENAHMYGTKKERYQVNSNIRYQCNEGFLQRRHPVVRCLHDGQWEKPQVECIMCEYLAVPYIYGMPCLAFNLRVNATVGIDIDIHIDIFASHSNDFQLTTL